MARTQYAPREEYTGTGLLTEYTFDFKIAALEDLQIIQYTDAFIQTFRVDGNDTTYLSSVVFDEGGGGTITLVANLPSGHFLVILLADDDPLQESEFRSKGDFRLSAIEDALDALSGQIQRLAYKAKKALRASESSMDVDAFDGELPSPMVPEEMVIINADGTGFDTISQTQVAFGPIGTVPNDDGASVAARVITLQPADATHGGVVSILAQTWAGIKTFIDYIRRSSETTITAFATGGQASATQLTKDINHITVCATNGDSVKLPVAIAGAEIIIINDGTADLAIFPATGEQIDTLAINAAYSLTTIEKNVRMICPVIGIWRAGTTGTAGSGLPVGGATGSVLAKLSAVDSDTEWHQYAYDGYSSRFAAAFTSTDLADTLAKIIVITYVAPTISLSAAGSGTVREKGASVASSLLSATVTKKSDPIDEVRFYEGINLVNTIATPNPAGGVETYNYAVPFTDNISFSAKVDDNGATGGPTTVTSNTVSFTFVYPYYSGAGAVGLTPAQVGALTKGIQVTAASVAKSFTATAGQVFYFAQPASYTALNSILDVNNFETIGDWTVSVANITGLDATAQSYRIYAFNNPVTAGTYTYTFKR
jgi:hypothetical protein